jgi:hypothetical protein
MHAKRKRIAVGAILAKKNPVFIFFFPAEIVAK